MTPLIINACTGRMGKELLKAAISDPGTDVTAAIARETHPLLGTDIGYLIGANPQGVFVGSDVMASLNGQYTNRRVLVDFSLPDHSMETLQKALVNLTPIVIGTTGFNETQQIEIEKAAQYIPIVYAANYSVGVNSLICLVKQATKLLGQESDIEIFEAHHKYKKDAPSGTALALAHAAAETMGKPLSEIAVENRQGERKSGDIGFSVMRAGDIVGTHEVVFALNGEMVTLRHEAQSRQCFAQGAINAAKWLCDKKAGLYNMQDVLGIKS
ncbi:MAG: 4-hydroxy-tetrahydrodipicolinate reductase [Kangiellaceae bacterium]|nr:4-hydroxy-tetrahydrodipicolinate reductase [Kangiellaceae bacterium]